MIKIKLSRLLGEKRITQKKLSEMTGIRANTIGELYNELVDRISLSQIDAICKALNCEISDILELITDEKRK